jgi:hypothetical protein
MSTDIKKDNNMNNENLYHYTTFKTAKKIFESMEIRFSKFNNVNDAKEFKSFGFMPLSSVTPTGTPEYFNGLQQKINKLDLERKNEWKVFCCTTDASTYTGGLISSIQRPQPAMPLGCCKDPMWCHYGKAYKGVCFVFDRSKLLDSLKKYCESNDGIDFFYAKVNYTELQNRIDSAKYFPAENYDIDLHIKKHWEEIFMTKSIDWEYEQEVRFLINDKNPENKNVCLPIKDILQGVVITENMKKENIHGIKEFCLNNSLFLKRLKWNNGLWILGKSLNLIPLVPEGRIQIFHHLIKKNFQNYFSR